ncbi:hypothetical protein E2562_039220 [Oryza meyeriana var. granulata]|uniref:Uncharacterized protein n=1 Tax=Oryza meyeriana var. granulata TaxID=110450 RepID=A0A6G1E8R6_9ORYZ|nr:hypothetical protein E2562_039220 [Oryza meyeriana var. granulata]
MHFMSLCQSKNAIVGVDHERRAVLLDTACHGIRMHRRNWLFHIIEEDDTETKRFVVLMGAEVEQDSDGGGNKALRMIKHKSKCYSLNLNKTIDLVV